MKINCVEERPAELQSTHARMLGENACSDCNVFACFLEHICYLAMSPSPCPTFASESPLPYEAWIPRISWGSYFCVDLVLDRGLSQKGFFLSKPLWTSRRFSNLEDGLDLRLKGFQKDIAEWNIFPFLFLSTNWFTGSAKNQLFYFANQKACFFIESQRNASNLY